MSIEVESNEKIKLLGPILKTHIESLKALRTYEMDALVGRLYDIGEVEAGELMTEAKDFIGMAILKLERILVKSA